MTRLPISKKCPNCQGVDFKGIKPEGLVAFTNDRECKNCGTRYTPPTPLWAAVVFIVVGLLILLINIAGIAVAASARSVSFDWRTGRFVFLTLPVGIGCAVYGIRCLRRQGDVTSTD
jgi:hypothetical protein